MKHTSQHVISLCQGLIRSTKQGGEHQNVMREDEINARFPGLLKLILKLPA